MKKINLVGYPEGNILRVTETQFNKLNELDLVKFDEEWTEETPNGQWGFDNKDEVEINKQLLI
jgi:hypothetical protein